MENRQVPGQEPQENIPDLLPENPETDLPPVMAEITFEPESHPISIEEIPEAAPVSEDPIAQELSPVVELPTEETMTTEEKQIPSAEAEMAVGDTDPSAEKTTPTPSGTDLPTAEPDVPAAASDLTSSLDNDLDNLLEDLSFLNQPEPVKEPANILEETNDQEYQDEGKEFESLFHASVKKESKQQDVQRPAQKGRPKRRKGEALFGIPNLLVTVVWLALILVIGTTLGRMLWVCAADVLAFGREDKPVTITIYEADTMNDIVDKLHEAGLIRYKSLFNLYAGISDAEEDIKPGIYDLNTRYDYHALVNFMSPRSSREVIKLTIPEGYTCRQIFALLEENRICTAVDLGAYAANGSLSEYWFLEGVERGSENSLEGYLFPDTYEFYKNSTPKEALEKMLDNFNYRFTEEMRSQIDAINANITGGGYTVREITIIASLIEKESAAPAESGDISGVIYNRLFNWEFPALLNIDAAIVYAQGGEADTIDTSLDSPYNTYTHVGLTPTPIANPGLSSLQAALNPATHDYYYYVLNPETGMHSFSTTQDEHNANIAAFYN